MKKILFSFIIVLLLCGVSLAQAPMGQRWQAFWEQEVDATTDWGQWLTVVYKPYLEELFEALQPLRSLDLTGLSADEMKKKTNDVSIAYYKALQAMTAPDELKAYHLKMLEVFGELTKEKKSTEMFEYTDQLKAEMAQELASIFLRHGVPQKIIDELQG